MNKEDDMLDDTRSNGRRFAFVHIGKTGGSAIKEAIKKDLELTGKRKVAVLGHRAKLPEIVEKGLKHDLCFTVREPVSRFISGFNSRLRGGRDGMHSWKPRELPVFERFSSPNELAEALSSADEATRTAAKAAMKSISHLKRDLTHHFGSVDLLEGIRDRIVFIGHLPSLDEDFKMFRTIVGLSPDAELPKDEVGAHRAPDTLVKKLSPLGEENVRKHYRKDYPIYEWCLKRREELIAEFQAGRAG